MYIIRYICISYHNIWLEYIKGTSLNIQLQLERHMSWKDLVLDTCRGMHTRSGLVIALSTLACKLYESGWVIISIVLSWILDYN